MATYIGFSTQHADNVITNGYTPGFVNTVGSNLQNSLPRSGNKYRTEDSDLVIQDLINSFNISPGALPGRPDIGTNIFSFIFEPNTVDNQLAIKTEIQRVVASDPRIELSSIDLTSTDLGVIVQVQLSINPFLDPITLQVYFDQQANKASLLTS